MPCSRVHAPVAIAARRGPKSSRSSGPFDGFRNRARGKRRDFSRAGRRGIVYLEFLFAFVPVFVLFLGICQLALISTARTLTKHAAVLGARSAIVVLEAPPRDFSGTPRGDLRAGGSEGRTLADAVRGGAGVLSDVVATGNSWLPSALGAASPKKVSDDGARMAAIRTASSFPLLALAPKLESLGNESTLSLSARGVAGTPEGTGVEYTNAATSVTIHVRGGAGPARSHVPSEADISVRVGYLFPCAVPIARVLLCSSFDDARELKFSSVDGTEATETVGTRDAWTATPGRMKELAPYLRFAPLLAQATLPNQGLGFEVSEEDE